VALPKNGLRGAGRYETVLRRRIFDSLVATANATQARNPLSLNPTENA